MRLNVGVIFGGKSVEHEVSIITALQIMENINQIKYCPIPIYLAKNNAFYYAKAMYSIDFFKTNHVEKFAKRVEVINQGEKVYLCEMKPRKLKKMFELDLIILAVHGANVEDGTLSAYCELRQIPYVGSNVLASAICQNKLLTKQVLEKHGLPIIPYTYFYETDYVNHPEQVLEQCEALGYPLVVKPASLGSSVGVNVGNQREELQSAIMTALLYDSCIVVEKAIQKMREFNCAVRGNQEVQYASLVEEVFKQDEILSFTDKYLGGGKSQKGIAATNREIPANAPAPLINQIQQLALKTFKVLGNSGISRIDFIFDLNGDRLYINEINTIPGSFAYYLWDKTLPFDALLDELIKLALYEYKRKSNKIKSYDLNLLTLSNSPLNKLKN